MDGCRCPRSGVRWNDGTQQPKCEAGGARTRRVFDSPSRGLEFHGTGVEFAVSPDGQHVAFVATSKAGSSIWVRSLAAVNPRPLPGTEGARNPFWSPDSQSIGFFAGNQLKEVLASGGSPVVSSRVRVFAWHGSRRSRRHRDLEQRRRDRLRAVQRRQPVSNQREEGWDADAGHDAGDDRNTSMAVVSPRRSTLPLFLCLASRRPTSCGWAR